MADISQLMGGDPMRLMSLFMQNGDVNMIKPWLDKVDLLKNGADVMQMACSMGKHEIVDLLVEKGVDILNPPELVQNDESYRRSPFIIQAAKSGNSDTYDAVKRHVLSKNSSPIETGCICISKKKKNVVISNAIGCAAFWGKH